MKYVHFARGRYSVRVTVPPDLRAIVGKRELVEPLAADKRMAEKAAHGVIARFLALLEAAAEKLESRKPTLSSAAKFYYRQGLEDDDLDRITPTLINEDSLPGERIDMLPGWAEYLRHLIAGRLDDDHAEMLIGAPADRLVATGMVPNLPRDQLLKFVAAIELEVVAAAQARNRGDIMPPAPRHPLLNQPEPDHEPAPSPAAQTGSGITLNQILVAFHGERTAGSRTLADKTMAEHKVAVRMLEEFLGTGLPARSIKRKDMLAYKQALLHAPSRYSLRFPGLTLPQAIKANLKREVPFPTLDPQTINMKWLSHISTIFKWAMNNGHLDDNPAAGVRVDEGKGHKEPSRVPFTQEDLKAIFGSPFYRSTPREKWQTRHWALLLALYTGARSSSELARIRIVDIFKEQGVDVIDLAMASKNTRSKRLVPIHKHLVDLGFLDHVERLRQLGQARLFPDWEPEDKVNRWFLRTYRDEIGITDERKVFHSFRHTLKTKLASYGVNRDVSDLITGHKDQSVAAVYIGDAATTMIKAMAEGLGRVDFDLPIAA